jgi:HEAT repeat protein
MPLFGLPNVKKMEAQGDVKGLIRVLRSKHESVRNSAADALARIGEPAVEPLIAALKDESTQVRDTAVVALGKTGDARAMEPLIAALKAESVLRPLAYDALVEIGKHTSVVEPLIAALKDQDQDIRLVAIRALGEIGDARAVEPLNAIVSAELDAIREGDSSAVSILLLGGAVQLALARIQESTSKAKVAET